MQMDRETGLRASSKETRAEESQMEMGGMEEAVAVAVAEAEEEKRLELHGKAFEEWMLKAADASIGEARTQDKIKGQKRERERERDTRTGWLAG